MADTKISALTTDSTPDRGADYGATYDASAVTNKKVLLKDFGGYVQTAVLGESVSPVDATTYYFGPFDWTAASVTDANHKIFIPRTGKVTRIYIHGIVTGTLGTTETSTISFRLNGTTDTTIVSTLNLSTAQFSASNTALGIAVTAGDYFNIKWVTPTWATNPTGVAMAVFVWFE